MTVATGEQILAADIVGLVTKTAIPFWGTIAEIPASWLICDGNNGTPNLLEKFLEGVATAATNPGTTGGATNKTTSTSTPDIQPGETGANTVQGAHSHTISDIRPKFYDVAFITLA